MTVWQASHYTCNRCKDVEIVQLNNSGPVTERMAGPPGWLTFRMGVSMEDGTLLRHFCPRCAEAFAQFVDRQVD